MDAREEPEFFIASKLRGIPLVTEVQNNQKPQISNKKESNNNFNNHQASSELQQDYPTSVRPKRQFSDQSSSSGVLGRQISVSVNGKPIDSQTMQFKSLPTRHPHENNGRGAQTLREMVMKDLEKRQVDQPVSLLFKPSASTASLQSRHSGSATTIKTTKVTTTKKPKLTTTTRKVTQTQFPRQEQSPPKSQQQQITPTKTPSTTSTSTTTTTSTSTKSPTVMASTVKDKGFREDRASIFDVSKGEHLSPLTTRQAPEYQQRQSLGRNQMSRGFREEPSAGKNWILFNKTDGSFSTFEVAVLVSNVAIVTTIIFVIIFTWIRTFNKKREASKIKSKKSDVESKVVTNADTASSGKFSDAFSSGDHPSAGNTPAPSRVSSIMSDVKPKSLTDERTGPGTKNLNNRLLAGPGDANDNTLPVRPASEASRLPAKAPPIVKPPDLDAKVNGNNNNNTPDSKVTAIVQPTEDQTTALTGATSQVTKASMKDKQASNAKSAAPNSSDTVVSTVPNTLAPKEGDLAKKQPASERIMSPNDSLQSIELPESLVQSIKRVEQSGQHQQHAAELKPSSNILLGEGDPTQQQAMEMLNKSVAKEVEDDAGKLMTIEAQIEPIPAQLKNKIDLDSKAAKLTADTNNKARPENPTGRDSVNERGGVPVVNNDDRTQAVNVDVSNKNTNDSGTRSHQVVINKLDKRKTKLEIVDIRDESVTGKMGDQGKNKSMSASSNDEKSDDLGQHWISMDGVAVTHQQQTPNQANMSTPPTITTKPISGLNKAVSDGHIMSPSEIIGNKFSVDYKQRGSSSSAAGTRGPPNAGDITKNDSIEDGAQNIEKEVEEDNQMKNRKYFVYIVHDGHFSAKKECIARIELPAKRKISLADVRQLIASSPDISLSSLRRNRFKFVTETYRLLNEDEDVANLHQVYPTQGVFLKLNVADQPESLSFPSQRGRSRLSSSSMSNNLQYQQQMMSGSGGSKTNLTRQRRPLRSSTNATPSKLPAIQVNDRTSNINKPRGRSSGPARNVPRPTPSLGARSKSGLDRNSNYSNLNNRNKMNNKASSSTALGRFIDEQIHMASGTSSKQSQLQGAKLDSIKTTTTTTTSPSSFGNDVIAGAKKLFNAIVV